MVKAGFCVTMTTVAGIGTPRHPAYCTITSFFFLLLFNAGRMWAHLLVWACLVPGWGVRGQGQGRSMTISALFDEDGEEIHELAFNHAVQVVNRNR